jgi:hypothetical protein
VRKRWEVMYWMDGFLCRSEREVGHHLVVYFD